MIDLVTMMGNLGRSLFEVQALITGFGYTLGIVFFMVAIGKAKEVAESPSQGNKFIPLAYLGMGAALLYLPSTLDTLSNTLFGSGNVLAYTQTYNPYSIYSSMRLLIQTSGLIWFVRGCVLMAHASHPGEQHGPKGLTFVFAGILAMNFEATIGWLNYAMNGLITIAMKVTQ
jgi:hypothetical protein